MNGCISALCVLSCFSHVQLFAILLTVDCQAPLSVGLSRQGYWSGLPCPPPGDLPDPETEAMSLIPPAMAEGSLPLALSRKPIFILRTGKLLVKLSSEVIWKAYQVPNNL